MEYFFFFFSPPLLLSFSVLYQHTAPFLTGHRFSKIESPTTTISQTLVPPLQRQHSTTVKVAPLKALPTTIKGSMHSVSLPRLPLPPSPSTTLLRYHSTLSLDFIETITTTIVCDSSVCNTYFFCELKIRSRKILWGDFDKAN